MLALRGYLHRQDEEEKEVERFRCPTQQGTSAVKCLDLADLQPPVQILTICVILKVDRHICTAD